MIDIITCAMSDKDHYVNSGIVQVIRARGPGHFDREGPGAGKARGRVHAYIPAQTFPTN